MVLQFLSTGIMYMISIEIKLLLNHNILLPVNVVPQRQIMEKFALWFEKHVPVYIF